MIPTRARLADLAAAAGVSTATVSRVLNGKPGVAKATRSQVLATLESLGYQLEQDQPTQKGFTAVILPELANPSFAAMATELSLLLSAADQPMILCASGPGATTEASYLESLLNIDLAGVISVSGSLADSLASPEPYRKIAAEVPTVFINSFSDAVPAAYFSASDAEAVAMSVAHLRSFGHEKIGLAIGQQRYLPTQRKVAAFLGLGFSQSSIASTIFSVEGGQAAAARLYESGHTAIICGSDLMALGAIREARARGLEVPRDISIVGYDDSSLMGFTSPALTTVRQPVQTMCQAAISTLLSAMRGLPVEHAEMMFHPDLIIRQSTGPRQ